MKTIKQIADSLGIDKQRVYRYIRKHHISEAHHEAGVMYFTDVVESCVNQHFFDSGCISEAHQEHIKTTSLDTVITLLQHELEMKNMQIKALQERLDEERAHNREQSAKLLILTEQAQKLTDNAQRLHAMENVTPKLADTRAKRIINWFKK
jgi:uncharacterized membrane protein YhiD involved in acid resistance